MSSTRALFLSVAALGLGVGATGCAATMTEPLRPWALRAGESAVFGRIEVTDSGKEVTWHCEIELSDAQGSTKAHAELESSGWVFLPMSAGPTFLSVVACELGSSTRYRAELKTRELEFEVPGPAKIAYFGHLHIDMRTKGDGVGVVAVLFGPAAAAIASADAGKDAVFAVDDQFEAARVEYGHRYGADGKVLEPVAAIAGERARLAARKVQEESQAREAEGAEIAANAEVLWKVWTTKHGERACEEARDLLMSDSECAGAACRAPLIFASEHQKRCPVDTDTKIALHRYKRRWEEAAGKATSRCLLEVYRSTVDAAGIVLSEKCDSQGKTEAALREAARFAAPSAAPN